MKNEFLCLICIHFSTMIPFNKIALQAHNSFLAFKLSHKHNIFFRSYFFDKKHLNNFPFYKILFLVGFSNATFCSAWTNGHTMKLYPGPVSCLE